MSVIIIINQNQNPIYCFFNLTFQSIPALTTIQILYVYGAMRVLLWCYGAYGVCVSVVPIVSLWCLWCLWCLRCL